MAEIPVKKKSGVPFWVWLILLVIIALLAWWILADDDDEVNNLETIETTEYFHESANLKIVDLA